jgi:hypothetical protein
MEYFVWRDANGDLRSLYRLEEDRVEAWLVNDEWRGISFTPETVRDPEKNTRIAAEDVPDVQRQMTEWEMDHGTKGVLENYFAFVSSIGAEPTALYRINVDSTVHVFDIEETWVASSITPPEIWGLGGATEYDLVKRYEDIPDVKLRVLAEMQAGRYRGHTQS